MSNKMNQQLCIVLNVVEEDYQTIWEIISVMSSRYPHLSDDKVLLQVYESLKYLLDCKFVQAFQGKKFNGDEALLENFELSFDFVLEHRNDWKNKQFNEKDIRFYISYEGGNALIHDCKQSWLYSS